MREERARKRVIGYVLGHVRLRWVRADRPQGEPGGLRTFSRLAWGLAALVGAGAVVGAAALAAAVAAAGAAGGTVHRRAHAAGASAALTSVQLGYLQLAIRGLNQRRQWAKGHWYCEYLGCTTAYPLLTIWGAAQMFEALDAVSLTDPTAKHLAQTRRVAREAQRYWNPKLHGYSPYLKDRMRSAELWFDDNGWLGLAFVNAYRATHNARYLRDAGRAYRFIAAHGWDSTSGGMWWNTDHSYHSGEALASGSLLAVLLYSANHDPGELANATRWIDWANHYDLGYDDLYMSGGPGSAAIDYVQAPLIYAQQVLCTETGQREYCNLAALQAQRVIHAWGTAYNLAPQYDSIFMQWMMAYGQAVGDPHWLALAQANATAAIQNARDPRGLWLGSWWGGAIEDPETHPDMLRTVGGTASLFAWLAYYS